MKRSLQVLGTIATASLLSLGMVGPAFADTGNPSSSQTVTGTLDTTIGAATSGDGLITLQAGTTVPDIDGVVSIDSNVAYNLSVVADKAHMTPWVVTDSVGAYRTDPALGSVLQAETANVDGATLGTVPLAGGDPLVLATDQAAGSHDFDMTLSQPVSWTDAPGTYHIVLTYTAAGTV